MTGNPIRVVLADDHPVVRSGLSALLASVPSVTVAGSAGNGAEAVRARDADLGRHGQRVFRESDTVRRRGRIQPGWLLTQSPSAAASRP